MLQLYKPEDYKRVLEAALLATSEPMTLSDLKKLFDEQFDDETWRTLIGRFAPGLVTKGRRTGTVGDRMAFPDQA